MFEKSCCFERRESMWHRNQMSRTKNSRKNSGAHALVLFVTPSPSALCVLPQATQPCTVEHVDALLALRGRLARQRSYKRSALLCAMVFCMIVNW